MKIVGLEAQACPSIVVEILEFLFLEASGHTKIVVVIVSVFDFEILTHPKIIADIEHVWPCSLGASQNDRYHCEGFGFEATPQPKTCS